MTACRTREGLRVSELREHQSEVLEMLEQGGAIIVHTDDESTCSAC